VTFANFCLTIIYMILLTICCHRILTPPDQWKTRVERAYSQSETALLNQRLAIGSDFTFVHILHPGITPSIV